MVTNGTLQPDNHQLEVVTRLQLLQRELEGHLPAGNGTRPSWIHKVLSTLLYFLLNDYFDLNFFSLDILMEADL